MKFIIIQILVLFSFAGLSQTQKLTIHFNDLSSNDGRIMILIQDEKEEEITKLVLFISNKSSKVSVYLPQGKYGVIAFHDINGNEELDKNFLGVPTEPYGFSNNARGFLSLPDIEETLINLTRDLDITFELK